VSAVAVFATLVPAIATAAGPFRFTEGEFKGGQLRYINGVPVLTVAGTPEEMGEQQAVLLGGAVAEMIQYPRKFVREAGYDAAWPFMVAMGRSLLENADDRYRREIDAMVQKTGVDRGTVVVANTMLELRRMGGCASLIVEDEKTTTDGPLFARNFDFHGLNLLDRYSLVIVYRPQGKRAFASVTWPGLVGVVSGMNDAGLTVATLDVYSSKDNSPKFDWQGVPMMLTFRRVLEECGTIAEAEKLLRATRHTTWMNLAVCDREGAAVFEITPDRVEVRRPTDHVLSCTNHFRTDALCTDEECQRFPILESARRDDRVSVDDAYALLHAVNQGELTIQAMVFEPKLLKLHVSLGPGPVTAHPPKTIDLKPLLRPAAE
jgi:hypothetical protein